MSAIVFLTGQTMGDACGSAGRSLKAEFESLGYEFIEVNLTRPDPMVYLDSILKSKQIEFAYSFVGFCNALTGTTSDGKEVNLWSTLNIPFVSLYGDSPAYFFSRHVAPTPGFVSLYAFPEHLQVRKRLPSVRGLLGTLPPVTVDVVPKQTINFSIKERGKLLFLKNGNDPEELLKLWRQNLSEVQFLMLMDLASELAAQLRTDVGNDIDSLVTSYFRNKGLDVEALLNLRLFFIAQLDDYYRRLKSTLIAESLLDFPIQVHGFNWAHVDFSRRRATLVPTADYNVSRELMKTALGVIDMSPNTGAIPHDRCRRSFGSYTLCITNEQECFRQRFPQYDQFSYQFGKDSLQHRINDVITHPKRYVDLGITIAEAYRSGDSLNATAQCMLEAANAARFEEASRFTGLQDYFSWPVRAA